MNKPWFFVYCALFISLAFACSAPIEQTHQGQGSAPPACDDPNGPMRDTELDNECVKTGTYVDAAVPKAFVCDPVHNTTPCAAPFNRCAPMFGSFQNVNEDGGFAVGLPLAWCCPEDACHER